VDYGGDKRLGTAMPDTLTAGAGDEVFRGLGGHDSVVFSGSLDQYAVSGNGVVRVVRALDGDGGADAVIDVERLVFDDMTVNLAIQIDAAGLPSASLQRLAELYVAFFNRIPDADGLAFWVTQTRDGKPLSEIADAFYAAGVQYGSITGYSADMGNADFVNLVYRNVLGRAEGADPGGLAHWTGLLASGQATRGLLVDSILNSAHTFKGDAQWGWVADLLDNKIAVAERFAVEWGLGFATPEASISRGMAIAAAVTSHDTQAALELVGLPWFDLG
jgi:serralysin